MTSKGFTLIELLISILLMLIISFMLFVMFSTARKLYITASSRAEVFSQGRVAIDALERDLQRILPDSGDLIMYSQIAPEDFSKANSLDQYVALQKDFPFELLPTDQTNRDIVPLLTFYTNTSWFSAHDHKFHSGPAQVSYYLRRRPDTVLPTGEAFGRPTAYLMRRIIPRRYTAYVSNDPNRQRDDDIPPEEEIAHSILECRLYATNNAASTYIAMSGDDTGEIFSRLDAQPTARWGALLRDADFPMPQQTVKVTRLDPIGSKPGKTFSFGPTAGGMVEHIRARKGLPFAIAIELTVTNDLYDIIDGEHTGTVRTFSRVIALPGAQGAPILSDRDRTRFRR